jgi:outer membrane protein
LRLVYPSVLWLVGLVALSAGAQEPARQLSLETALTRARASNPTLRGAAAQSEAADARQDRARSSLLPQIGGTASYSRTTGNFIPRPGQLPTQVSSAPKSDWDMFNSFTFGATASLLLYDFQGSIDRFRSAKESNHAAQERVRATELSVDFAVRDAFFRARAQRALVSVARETLANNQRHVEQIQAFVEVGTRPEIDLLQVRTELANARVSLLQAENGYAIAKANLQRAMGSDEETAFEVADERLAPIENEQAPLGELLKEAVERRPDVVALERDLRASALSETAVRGAFGPSVSAVASGTRGGVALDDLRWNVAAGVQLNWPIVRGGATFAEQREARANVKRVEASITELRQTVRLQVEQARLGLSAAAAVLQAAAEALENAKGRLSLAEGRYEAGVGNIIELGDAQVALTQAEAQSVSAEYSLSMARAQLISALGRSR